MWIKGIDDAPLSEKGPSPQIERRKKKKKRRERDVETKDAKSAAIAGRQFIVIA